jgi:hypothetical protein
VRVFDGFDARLSAVLRELDESDRSVQISAKSTSIWPSERISKFGRDVPNPRSISTQASLGVAGLDDDPEDDDFAAAFDGA